MAGGRWIFGTGGRAGRVRDSWLTALTRFLPEQDRRIWQRAVRAFRRLIAGLPVPPSSHPWTPNCVGFLRFPGND